MVGSTTRRPPLFQVPESAVTGKLKALEEEIASLKGQLAEAAQRTWTGLRGPQSKSRVVISKEGLIQSIPLPKSLERDISWHTDGRMGKVEAAFNPSIFRLSDGRTWMAYRVECFPWFRFSKVAIVQLNDLFCPIPETNRLLDLPTDYDNYNAEDPRFVAELDGSVLLAYNDGFRQAIATLRYPSFTVESHRFFREIGGMEIAEKEKNWTFFRNGERAIYSLNPLRILSTGLEASLLSETRGVNDWPHGEPRGGTQIFQLNGWASHFFHSSVKIADSKHGPVRQYFAGLLCHDPSTMAPVAISERPILIGSPCSVEDRPSQHQVVFPCGVVDLGRSVVMSYGLDDLDCALEVVEKDALIQGLRKL